MKKTIILFLAIVAILMIVGCSQPSSPESKESPAVETTEKEAADSEVQPACEQVVIDYEISNIVSKIEPRPSQAQRQYDTGYMQFTLLSKDKEVNGYFNVSMECTMSDKSVTKESRYLNLHAGSREDIKLICSKRGTISSLQGPFVESAPTKEVCS